MKSRETVRGLVIVLVGVAAIVLGARIEVPMVPVPMTLQTLALVGLALLAGPREATAAAILYWILVLAGLPVLSGGKALDGESFFQLKTAGYVLGFIPAAFVVGLLGYGRDFKQRVTAGLLGHGVVLGLGVVVLVYWIGPFSALKHGFLPFLLGAVVKSVVAAGMSGRFWETAPKNNS